MNAGGASAPPNEEALGRREGSPLVLGYDGSDGARLAIEHAGLLLGDRRALVTAVWPAPTELVLPGSPSPTPELAEAAAQLDAAMAADGEQLAAEGTRIAQAAGLEATPQAIRGEPAVWPALVRTARERDAVAIVVGSRGLSGVRSALLGSVSRGVLEHGGRPTLVVPPGARAARGGPAVLCYDGSEPAGRAIDAAGELLAPHPAIALTAWRSSAGLGGFGAAALPREVVREACARLDEEAERRADATAQAGAERARAAGFADVWPLAARVEANPWATLAGVAAQRSAVVLVVGARGLSTVRSAVLGSISRGVATHASAPVLVVPPGD